MAAKDLTAALGGPHDVAVVMGSGWAPAADAFGPALASVAIGELPGFAAPTAVGHGGEVRSVRVGDRGVLLFLDLTHLYSARLRALARELDPDLAEGVYAALPGPHYETPAEIRMLRTLGADLVGMSTALEAIAARAAGLEVFGLSMVTNAAAGITGEKLDHREVLAAGKAAAGRLGQFLVELIGRLP